MVKSYSLLHICLLLLIFSSCQSVEQISIQYMQPADMSFPSQIRKVAVVSNVEEKADDKPITVEEKTKGPSELSRSTVYMNGDTRITAKILAEEIAGQNYFDEIVVCDSSIHKSTFNKEEIQQLASDLDVDLIIAVERLLLETTKTVRYLPDDQSYQGAMDVKVYPTIKIYLPASNKLMATLQPVDSIFWEDFFPTETAASGHFISKKRILQESAEFAGTMPVKQIVPIWEKGVRYLYKRGSISMRDASAYVRKGLWDNAYELWNQSFEKTKNVKKKMRAALNIAVYYEMKDELKKAIEWAEKSMQYTVKTSEKNVDSQYQDSFVNNMQNFNIVSRYIAELYERNELLPKLNAQLERFKD